MPVPEPCPRKNPPECGRIENAAPDVRGCQMPSRLGWPDSVRGGLQVLAFSKSIFVAAPARLPAPAGVIFGAGVWATASASSGKTITMVTRSKADLIESLLPSVSAVPPRSYDFGAGRYGG